MRKIEIVVIGLIFGAIPIIVGFLAGWWLSIPFVPESLIVVGAVAGVVVGIVIDAAFLRKWVRQAYLLSPIVWVGIYVFYSAGLFGMFMGVPIFNVGLAVPAGFFVGAYLAQRSIQPLAVQSASRRSAMVTTCILALVCAASAFFALRDPYTASGLQGMLRLGFTVTTPMIVGVIVFGGGLILILHWWLNEKSVELTYRYLTRQAERLSAS